MRLCTLCSILHRLVYGATEEYTLELIEGIILGPEAGFAAAFIGSSIARMIKPDELWMFGMIAEPISVLTAGLLAKARWKPALTLYAVMLLASPYPSVRKRASNMDYFRRLICLVSYLSRFEVWQVPFWEQL
ncbi:MAG: hypothetical protein ACP5IM_06025 [Candidatus Bathyarchaeia archaeon]